jgi:hypothetical protein
VTEQKKSIFHAVYIVKVSVSCIVNIDNCTPGCVASFPPWQPRPEHDLGHVGFVVDKVALV